MRYRVPYILGHHCNNTVFNQMLIPHAMRAISAQARARSRSKEDIISPFVYCKLLEVMSLAAPGFTTNKGNMMRFVSFIMEFVKSADVSKMRDENTILVRKCVASLNFIASLHICKMT